MYRSGCPITNVLDLIGDKWSLLIIRDLFMGRKTFKEFLNAPVKAFLQEQGIKPFTTENETIKASIVERFNRSLRGKIHRLLTSRSGRRYIDALPAFVDAYNRTVHSSTGLAPADVGWHNADDVWFRLYESDGRCAKKKTKTQCWSVRQNKHGQIKF